MNLKVPNSKDKLAVLNYGLAYHTTCVTKETVFVQNKIELFNLAKNPSGKKLTKKVERVFTFGGKNDLGDVNNNLWELKVSSNDSWLTQTRDWTSR
jgi:hypothetical protein